MFLWLNHFVPYATVYLSLGSNVGNRALHIKRAVGMLRRAHVRVLRQSPLYETEPVGLRAQRWFLNCVVEARTLLPPLRLLRLLLFIERRLGRRRTLRNAPRPLDLDILFYGSRIVRSPRLSIPHPRLTQRRFVLLPLADLSPELRHPLSRSTISQLLAQCPDRSEVRLWKEHTAP